MINFTLRGRNFPAKAAYWIPYAYEDINNTTTWIYQLPDKAPISQVVPFNNVPSNLGFIVFFKDAAGGDVSGPYGAASTSRFLLENNAKYILDFHGEVGIPIFQEEAPPGGFSLEMLLPMMPNEGPPLPRFLGIYWPWYKPT